MSPIVDRKETEAAFHDSLRAHTAWQRYTSDADAAVRHDPNWSNFKFYAIERKSRSFTDEWIRERCAGKRILDYACGNGDDAIFAAANGAHAVGIDISPTSIEHARRKAHAAGLCAKTEFHVMDAENLGFADDSFDLVVIYGVLHHLDFDRAMRELSRVLKPTGSIICTEALAHNPLIHWYRCRTPHLRTEWEVNHILRKETIARAKQWFESVSCRFYHLATIAAVPLRRNRLFPYVLSMLELADEVLLRVPCLQWQAWQVIIELQRPRRAT